MTDIQLDVTKFTVGDILDLSAPDVDISLVDKLRIIDRGVVKGNLRSVPILELPEVIEQITTAIKEQANPT